MSDSNHLLALSVDHATAFDVRKFVLREAMHTLFRVEVEVVTDDLHVDLESLIGRDATFRLRRADGVTERSWSGLVTNCAHIGIDDNQLGTYRIELAPRMWLLDQRRNYRVFQQLSDPDIALMVLHEWGLDPRSAFDSALYPPRKYRVQYAETDYRFVCRLLEDAGICFYFEEHDGKSRLVLDDAPHDGPLREEPLAYDSSAADGLRREIAYDVEVGRRVRPGRYRQRDVDYRREPEFPVAASAGAGLDVEQRLERFHLNYGAFLFHTESAGETPVADDRGPARTRLDVGQRQVERRLAAKRVEARRCGFKTTAHDLGPGQVFHFGRHPRPELAEGQRLLVLASVLTGTIVEDWEHHIDAHFAEAAYHPPLTTPKPKTFGLESATVVGPDDDEIHTDEFARVRVQFHWDREGKRDPQSSCWIPVSQPWGGAGFGAVNIPRVGQEVLVQFLGADPDRPVVMGRVFTKTNPVPYKLPEHKTVSGIRSRSANQMMMGANDPLTAAEQVLASYLGDDDLPAGRDVIQDALDGSLFNASSPNGEAHLWPGSEVTMNDTLGQETLYMQAQRNMNTVVNNDQSAIIGNRRATRVGGNDVLDVDGNQYVGTLSDRMVAVEGGQRHVVTGEIIQQSLTGSQHFVAEEEVSLTSRAQMHGAAESVAYQVGDSTLLMTPDFVILQTPQLFINPGLGALQVALTTGEAPPSPAAAHAARVQAAQDAHDAEVRRVEGILDDAWRNGDLSLTNQAYSFPHLHPPLEGVDMDVFSEAWGRFVGGFPVEQIQWGRFPVPP